MRRWSYDRADPARQSLQRSPMNRDPAVSVVDVGKTSAKVVAVDRSGVVCGRLAHANRSSDAGPYRHVEVDELFEWIVEALQAVAAAEAIEAVEPLRTAPLRLWWTPSERPRLPKLSPQAQSRAHLLPPSPSHPSFPTPLVPNP